MKWVQVTVGGRVGVLCTSEAADGAALYWTARCPRCRAARKNAKGFYCTVLVHLRSELPETHCLRMTSTEVQMKGV